MANRRMFSARITESTRFIKMPVSSQNLYFHLGMKADDDGIVEAYPVMCTIGATEDDLRILVGKQFVTVLDENYVTFINDWTESNNIRADRKVDSIYRDLLLRVFPDAKVKESKKIICQTNDGQMTDKCLPKDSIGKDRLGQGSIGKGSISKDNIDKDIICPEPKANNQESSPDNSDILLPLVDKTMYNVPLSKINTWSVAYPAVDIKQELFKMLAWLDANPNRKKTRKGIERFICTWLSREQDKGGVYKNGSRTQTKENVFTGDL